MKYQAILFDMDGTVVDSLADIVDAVNYAMARFGQRTYTLEELRPLVGNGAATLIRRALPPESDEAYVAEVLEFYLPHYSAHCGDKTRPFPGIVPLLQKLKEDGLRLAILSNKPDAAVQPLAKEYFSGLMELAEGERPGIRRKPWPDMIDSAAARLGVEKGRCLYVGDSEVDVETAKNAGIDCAAVSWGFRSREELSAAGASVILDTPEELLRFIEQ